MSELLILSFAPIPLCLVVLGLWRWLAGPSRGWRGAAIRVGVVALASACVVLVLAWQISRSRTFQLFGESVARVDTARKLVALTFDDGPTPGFTEEVLSILRQHGVKATFFVTGHELEQHPAEGRAIVRDGHELGNHSYSHVRMLGRSLSFIADELDRTDRLIRSVGHQGPIYFRPPYGKKLILLPYHLSRTDRVSVLCDVEPDSYAEIAASPDKIVAHVLEQVRPGSIILLHVMYESRATSRQALPGILAGLKARGYELVPVARLLAGR